MRTILVCQGTGCTSSKSPKIMQNFEELIKEKNIEDAIKYSNYKLYREDINDRKKLNSIFKNNKIDIHIFTPSKFYLNILYNNLYKCNLYKI